MVSGKQDMQDHGRWQPPAQTPHKPTLGIHITGTQDDPRRAQPRRRGIVWSLSIQSMKGHSPGSVWVNPADCRGRGESLRYVRSGKRIQRKGDIDDQSILHDVLLVIRADEL